MKVIVIEHDKQHLDEIEPILKIRRPNCQCFSTNKGREGIELVGNTDPDLVILDLEVTDMDGFQAIKEIRRISTVPLVVLSRVKGDEAVIAKALYYGADRFINKPFRPLEFISRVQALLRRTDWNRFYRHKLDMEDLMVASQSIKEAGQDKEEEQYQEAFSVN